MRVVLDTVILVRGLINPFSLWGRVIFDFAGRYRWLVSPAVVDEYVDVLNRPELVRKYRTVATRDLDTVLGNLATALVVEPSATPAVCRDPEDDKLLAAALAEPHNSSSPRIWTCSIWAATKGFKSQPLRRSCARLRRR